MDALCRSCGSVIEPFMSFGLQPISQAFRTPDDESEEFVFELVPAICRDCGLFQLVETPPPERLFHDSYAFRTATSRRMVAHFQAWANELVSTYHLDDSLLVVEIGCNDGTMLRRLAQQGVRHLGVEPARRAADVARGLGLRVQDGFFSEEAARRIRREHGPARLIVAANVLAHIPDLHDLGLALTHLLTEDGVLTFEVVYLLDVLVNTAFDQIYDEHVFTWSVGSAARALHRYGLEVVDVARQSTHGGSIRFVVARTGVLSPSTRVAAALEAERAAGLDDPSTYVAFRERCERTRDELRELLRFLRNRGCRVAGYGATAKSATLLNYCGIDGSTIEFIADNTPEKQGLLTPRTRIPIRGPEHFASRPPDHTLLFAWNHREEIQQKERWFQKRGGHWVMYVPFVAVT